MEVAVFWDVNVKVAVVWDVTVKVSVVRAMATQSLGIGRRQNAGNYFYQITRRHIPEDNILEKV